MRRLVLRASLAAAIGLVIATIAAAPAHAEIYAGRFGSVGEPDVISVFANGATGNVAPIRVIGGPLTGVGNVNGMGYDAVEDLLYVAEFSAQRILVLDALGPGTAPPLRTIESPQLGQPRGVAIDRAHDELFTIAQLCCLATFPRSVDGSVAPIRRVAGPDTLLTNPIAPVYIADRDEIAVPDFRQVDATVDGEILVFARTANGNTAPLRVIRGPNTRLGNDTVWSIAYDEAHGELYALVTAQDDPFLQERAIVVHAIGADGDATPLRVIQGDQTTLSGGVGIAYDAATETVVATNNSGSNLASIAVFPRLASGNVAPSQLIAGPNAGSDGLDTLVAVTHDPVFDDGFE